jgi:hypothetical protein
LFEPQLNFALEEDKLHHQFYFRNKQPKANEILKYVPTGGGDTEETYADIVLLPNLENTGYVLILSGITMAASEAAGDLVASSSFSGEISHLLGRDAARNRYFELLLKTRTIAGAARNSQNRGLSHAAIQRNRQLKTRAVTARLLRKLLLSRPEAQSPDRVLKSRERFENIDEHL